MDAKRAAEQSANSDRGHPKDDEGIEASPCQQACAGKSHAADGIQREGGGFDDLGALAREAHDRNVTGAACLSYGRVERGDNREDDG